MKRSAIRKNLPLIITGVIALVVVSAAAYVHFHRPKKTVDTVPSTNSTNNSPANTANHPGAGTAGVNNTGTTPGPSEPPATPPPATRPPSSTGLAIPTGQLLSKHTISLSGVDQSNNPSEVSTCATASGANCTIRLTGPNGSIKYAVDQPISADGQGNVAINWNAKDRGLTSGKWKVEAVASGGNQTAVSEPDYLTVNP